MSVMKYICAWCHQELPGTENGDTESNYEISHGICHSCRDAVRGENHQTMIQFLDKIGRPVMVINEEGRVVQANKNAEEMLGAPRESMWEKKGGVVMQCAYSLLPGGCGNTIHCQGCTIRNTVMTTFETGLSQKRVPALLNRQTADRIEPVRFHISTEKINDVVLLRVDEVAQE